MPRAADKVVAVRISPEDQNDGARTTDPLVQARADESLHARHVRVDAVQSQALPVAGVSGTPNRRDRACGGQHPVAGVVAVAARICHRRTCRSRWNALAGNAPGAAVDSHGGLRPRLEHCWHSRLDPGAPESPNGRLGADSTIARSSGTRQQYTIAGNLLLVQNVPGDTNIMGMLRALPIEVPYCIAAAASLPALTGK